MPKKGGKGKDAKKGGKKGGEKKEETKEAPAKK